MRRSVILFLLVFTVALVFAQKPAYRIEVQIEGLKDTSLLLGYHYGDKKFVTDTAKVDSKGVAVFTGDSLLKGGIYLVILPEKTFFEILVSDNQHFSVKTTKENFHENIKFKNSSENEAFLDYQNFMIDMQKRNKELSDQMKEALKDTVKSQELKGKLNDLNAEVIKYWDSVIDKHKGEFLGSLVKAMKNVDIPEYTVPENATNPDSLRWAHGYQFNKVHYFDNIDFSDSRLLRTPILEGKINTYFDRVLIPNPDSIIPQAIDLIEKSKANKEMFQYVLSFLSNKFITSERMGMDGVFVVIAEKYYLSGEAWWADQKMIDKFKERVSALKPNLIGNIAPDLWLPNEHGKYFRLSDVKAKITVVYFWDPECGHCKKITPELKKTYDKYKSKGLSVYGVYTQGDQPKWMEYIEKNGLTWLNVWDPTFSSNFRNLYDIYSTPVMFVLDSNKKIIIKRISVETLNQYLEAELK
ncbi:MAG: redoxin domain-containing protein [Bacteroidales bacterium]